MVTSSGIVDIIKIEEKHLYVNKDMTINDIIDTVSTILKQNREKLMEKGTVGMYQIEGTVNGVDYVVGLNKARIFYYIT